MVKKSKGSDYSVEEGPSFDSSLPVNSFLDELLSKYSDTDLLDKIEYLHQSGLRFLNERRFENALREFDRILELNPIDKDALLHKGEILAKTGNRVSAIQTFEKILEFDPYSVDAQLHIAYVLGTERKHREAVQYYDRVLELDQNNAEAMLNKSCELIKLGLNLEALEAIRKIKTMSKDSMTDAYAWFNQGEAYFNLKEFEQALEAFDIVLGADPKDDEAWYMKARCLSQMKREDEADKALFVATSINPALRYRIRKKT
jgi:tetratricopeptide (TPR) repeat protein